MRRVTFRLMLPGILSAGIYAATTCFDTFEVPAVLGMPRGIHVFATKIYTAVATEIPVQYGMASTFGTLLLAIAVMWVYLYGRATSRVEAYATVTGKGYRSRPTDLGKWKYGGTTLFIIYFLSLSLRRCVSWSGGVFCQDTSRLQLRL